MKTGRSLAALAAMLVIGGYAAAGPASGSAGPVVRTEAGAVRGSAGAVLAFKGIPYAAPPVGARRWTAPAPAVPWQGVRDATRFGHDCMQLRWIVMSGNAFDEDCLTMNVWTTGVGTKHRRPVLVFVYGGGFIGGTGAYGMYDGTELARDGAVVVSFNYRVGILGFLAHPALSAESPRHASGNYGLLDQLAALRWVKKNIAAFGGDPARVTVFGESAGAASIALLLASPQARGLVDGAILQSPTVEPLAGLARAEQAGASLAATLGADLATLRSLPGEELVKHNFEFAPEHGRDLLPVRFPAPIVDGDVLPSAPRAAFRAGGVLGVPVIVGVNGDEGRMFAPEVPPTAAGYADLVRRTYGNDAAALLAAVPARSDAEAPAALSALIGDLTFNESARLIARGAARRNPRTFSYVFTRVPGGTGLPATHSEELPYVFGTFNAPDFTKHAPPTAQDRATAATIRKMWIRFAATGDPNGPGLPHWPAATGEGDPYLEIGATFLPKRGFRHEALDAVERALAADEAR